MPQYEDLTGRKIGRLTVLEKGKGRTTAGGYYKTTWICQCECGTIKEIDAEKLKRAKTLSCGCLKSEKIAKVNFEDLTGQKFNRLTVIRYLDKSERKTRGYNWLCECDCGNVIHAKATWLKTGHTKSCGCYEKEFIGNLNKKYQHRNIRLYRLYKAMIERCTNPKHKRYKSYGGRGITVCAEWADSQKGFDVFYEWAMSHGYSENLTIDRIDNYKGYSPDNCRWITNQAQQNNKRYHRYIDYNGTRYTCADLSRLLGIPYKKLLNGYFNKNLTVQQIIDKNLG